MGIREVLGTAGDALKPNPNRSISNFFLLLV
jgi:hypothetical protein